MQISGGSDKRNLEVKVVHTAELLLNIRKQVSELVQLKLNIESSVGDSTPTEAE